jgi:hypothetical protein
MIELDMATGVGSGPDWVVDGIYAQRSTVAPPSSPAAAQRCAEGAGLDGDEHGSQHDQSCRPSRQIMQPISISAGAGTPDERIRYTSNLHSLDGRDR